jgi:hypothetical protein
MDARVAKLKLKLRGDLSVEDVQALVEAGYGTPRKIKAATDDELTRVRGIGRGKLDKLRAKMPRRGAS